MKVGIVGASGYVGGEVLRLLVSHPQVEVSMVPVHGVGINNSPPMP